MFAFKILNLREYSERIILILLSLTLGLIALLFTYSELNLSKFPLPHIPFHILTFILAAGYVLTGDTFYKIFHNDKKRNCHLTISYSMLYLIYLILPPILLRLNLFFLSLVLCSLSLFLTVMILKKCHLSKLPLFSILFHAFLNLYMLYMAFASILIY